MQKKSNKSNFRDIIIYSITALLITFFATADKIQQYDNIAVLMGIWLIPILVLYFTVIRDFINHSIKNKTFWIMGMIVLPLPTALFYAFRRKDLLSN